MVLLGVRAAFLPHELQADALELGTQDWASGKAPSLEVYCGQTMWGALTQGDSTRGQEVNEVGRADTGVLRGEEDAPGGGRDLCTRACVWQGRWHGRDVCLGTIPGAVPSHPLVFLLFRALHTHSRPQAFVLQPRLACPLHQAGHHSCGWHDLPSPLGRPHCAHARQPVPLRPSMGIGVNSGSHCHRAVQSRCGWIRALCLVHMSHTHSVTERSCQATVQGVCATLCPQQPSGCSSPVAVVAARCGPTHISPLQPCGALATWLP